MKERKKEQGKKIQVCKYLQKYITHQLYANNKSCVDAMITDTVTLM